MLLLSKILLVIAAPFMGSFLGAVITRWSSGRPLYSGRATCDCGQIVLSPRDMIPIASWASNRGRCRICARGLGRLYPAIEIAALIIALWSIFALPGEYVWTGAAFGWTLMVIVMIAWLREKLPITLVLGIGIAGLLLAGGASGSNLIDRLLGAGIAFVVCFAAVETANLRKQRRNLRPLDAVLPAALSLWFGFEYLFGFVFFSIIATLTLNWVWTRFDLINCRGAVAASLCLVTWLVWLHPLSALF